MQVRYECDLCSKVSCNKEAAIQHSRDKHEGKANVFPVRNKRELIAENHQLRARLEQEECAGFRAGIEAVAKWAKTERQICNQQGDRAGAVAYRRMCVKALALSLASPTDTEELERIKETEFDKGYDQAVEDTAMTDALKKLIVEVEAGRWPPDAEILKPVMDHYTIVNAAFCGSLDAAKALHEALLPGWEWMASFRGWVDVWDPDGDGTRVVRGKREDPARAWLLAILGAKLVQEEKG